MLFEGFQVARSGRLLRRNAVCPAVPSIAGMSAGVLTEIGGLTPAAEDGRGSDVIGKAAGQETRAIIVPEADRVGQAVIEAVSAIVSARMPDARRDDGGAEQGGGDKPVSTLLQESWDETIGSVRALITQE